MRKYAELVGLCGTCPIMRKIMRAHNRIIQPSLIATSIILSKLGLLQLTKYCPNLTKSQITCLQQIQNSLAHAAVKAPKSRHCLHSSLAPELPNTSNTSSSRSPTKSSKPAKINTGICIVLFSFNLHATHTHTHSLSLPFWLLLLTQPHMYN